VVLTGREPQVQPLLSSNSRDYSPDISPDGEYVVMSSARSGTPQLWIFRKDGTSPRQITFLGNAGASVPRWSWDGKLIAFESRPDGNADIFAVDVQSGNIERITRQDSTETRASFARDNRHVYFGSASEGRAFDLFRAPLSGGRPERVTNSGGLFGVESPDRKWIYYTTPDPKSEVRRVPLSGGNPEVVARNVHGRSALCAGRTGLYYLSASAPDGSSSLLFLPDNGKEPRPIVQITRPVHNAIALAPDETYLLYTEMRLPESDLFLVDNFR
jgi:Tol biopolymer transport system component